MPHTATIMTGDSPKKRKSAGRTGDENADVREVRRTEETMRLREDYSLFMRSVEVSGLVL